MECNRDEAVRAREIAEQKYAVQDFLGAKKFVLKAQQLFPGLEGISQMLPVLEVHSVAQLKLGGTETDWYGILQVEPSADDGTIKKQYRRLALLLHPDKNKALGAEAAFKLIGEAWGILSDKNKRTLHDMRRIAKGKPIPPRVSAESNVQSFSTTYHPPPAPNYNAPAAPTPPNFAQTIPNPTFWTLCTRCKMQYQYLRTYENYQLQCPKCKEVFLARDMYANASNNTGSNAANGGFGWVPVPDAPRQDFTFNRPPFGTTFNGGVAATNGFMNGAGTGPFVNTFANKPAANPGYFSSAAAAAAAQSKVAAAAAATAASSAVPPNNLAAEVVQQTYQKVKRERVEAEKEIKRKEKEQRKKERDDKLKEKKLRDQELAKQAMIKLMAKRKENTLKEEKRRVDTKPTRKLKRKKRGGSDQEDDDELADEDAGLSDHVPQEELQQPRRRSSRAKKNVTTYKVDVSDDESDVEGGGPALKRTRVASEEGEADASVDEANGRESMQRENGGKSSKVIGDDSDQKRGGGINGGEELGRTSAWSERRKDGQSTAFVETLRKSEGVARESKVFESSKIKPGKTSQRADSALNGKGAGWEANQEGGKISKAGDLRDEKSPSKSPRTLRVRVKSPEPMKDTRFMQAQKEEKGSMSKVDSGRRKNRAASPMASAASRSSEQEEEDPEDDDEGENEAEDDDEGEEHEEEEHIDVPDPDFHDFDSVRTEQDIAPGQVWAIYDDQDGMPRFYGRISRCTHDPFKVNMSWLELSPTAEELKTWSNSTGLSVTCGEFRIGKPTSIDQINIFSHVILQKAPKGLLKIYPSKGDVWAVYKDWDPEQNFYPEKVEKSNGEGSTYHYEMVEILSDFCKEQGVKTVKLTKVKGFKTVFFRQEEQDAIRLFKSSEMARFSHCVPAERMKGVEFERLGIPQGAVELDPAATPMDLIIGSSDQSR